jgi:GxxExxY protein
MNANERESLIHNVVGAVYEVSNVLGAGFLEKVYERALVRELRSRGMKAETQVPCPIANKVDCVGEYFIDILVEDYLPIELKCVDHLANEHLAQCLNYLKATERNIALLVNFQKPKAEWKRVVLGL